MITAEEARTNVESNYESNKVAFLNCIDIIIRKESLESKNSTCFEFKTGVKFQDIKITLENLGYKVYLFGNTIWINW